MSAQLQFEITNQIIKRVDDFKVVGDSQNYLYAKFDFKTEEWDGLDKTVLFRNGFNGTVYEILLPAEDDTCIVPHEVLAGEFDYFFVSLFAGDLITANIVKVFIDESGYWPDAESSVEPTPSIYEQILARIKEIEDKTDVKKITELIQELLKDVPKMLYNTTAYWNSQVDLIAEEGVIYLYTDHVAVHGEDEEVTYYAGVKVGDGLAYLIDIPFVGEYIIDKHMQDEISHINQEEREFWNNKVTCYMDSEDPETIILTKENVLTLP